MMDFLRKNTRIIFIITITGFLAGAFIGFGGYFFGQKTTADAALEVNGKKISYTKYANLLNRTLNNIRMQSKQEITEDIVNRTKQEVIQDLIQEEVFWEESKKYGITVSNGEIAADIQRYPAFQKQGRFDRQLYFQMLYQALNTTPKEFEESRRKQIAIMKLRYLIASSVNISENELKMEYDRIQKAKPANFEKDKDKFLTNLRQEKVMMVFNEWFKILNQSMKIKVNLEEIERGAGKKS